MSGNSRKTGEICEPESAVVRLSFRSTGKTLFPVGERSAVYWLNHRIEESEMNDKEKLLEIELQLAELNRSR